MHLSSTFADARAPASDLLFPTTPPDRGRAAPGRRTPVVHPRARSRNRGCRHSRCYGSTPSTPPTPPAPGTGKTPTTPARPRTPVPPQVRSGDPRASRCRPARDAGQGRRAPAHPYTPLRGEPGAAAVLDADRRLPSLPPRAAAIAPADLVLEPSAGTGLLAIFAELAGAALVLNELADDPRRSARPALSRSSPSRAIDAAHIDDHLDPGAAADRRADEPAVLGRGTCRGRRCRRRPAPCRVGARAPCRWRAAGRDHRRQPLSRSSRPGATPSSACRNAGASSSQRGDRRARLCPPRHDGRDPADGHRSRAGSRIRRAFQRRPGMAPDAATLLAWVAAARAAALAGRRPASFGRLRASLACPRQARILRHAPRRARPPARVRGRGRSSSPMRPVDWKPAEDGRLTEALYEPYGLQSIRIAGARRIRRGSCSPRRWPRSRRPSPPTGRTCRPSVVTDGLLSDAQLESVIYAGEAHSGHLAGSWTGRRDLRRRLGRAR